jgi:hypothetical protein
MWRCLRHARSGLPRVTSPGCRTRDCCSSPTASCPRRMCTHAASGSLPTATCRQARVRGPWQRSQTHGRRRARSGQAHAPLPMLDGISTVLQRTLCGPDGRRRLAWYLSQPALFALPLAMLRSGHLIPMSRDTTPPPAGGDSYCPLLPGPCVARRAVPARARVPWLRTCHVLLSCSSSQQLARLQALIEYCQAFESAAHGAVRSAGFGTSISRSLHPV